MQEARGKVQQCILVADKDADWRTALEREARILETVNAAYEKERLLVYVQPVSGTTPPAPTGKVVVAVVPYKAPAFSDSYFL